MRKVILQTTIFGILVMVLSACGNRDRSSIISAGNMAETNILSSEGKSNSDFSSFYAATLSGEEANQNIFADYDLTMINIWATFCGPCLKEMPDLGEINREYKDKKFQVVGIVTDVINSNGSLSERHIKKAKDIVSKAGADYIHLIPTYDLQISKLKDVTSVPATIFVDKDGNIVGEEHLGDKSKKAWIEIIDEYLGKIN